MTPEGSVVFFVVPTGLDTPQSVSGGNVFDRRVRDGLSRIGWDVRMREIDVDAAPAAPTFSGIPDGARVLVDGLVARSRPSEVEAAAARLRVSVIAHMVSSAFAGADPDAVEAERRALTAAHHVIATSAWTRAELLRRWRLAPDRVSVVIPGADDAPAATGTPTGAALLCVGVVAPHKGQDTLIEALVMLGRDAPWRCTIAGSVAAHPGFADSVARRARDAGLGDRIRLAGVLVGDELDEAYQSADLLVAPSRTESYGLAIADAVRRGIPVLASRVGGIPQAVGTGAAVLVPPGDPRVLSEALRGWMLDPALRARLKAEAGRGRFHLPHWDDTSAQVATTLVGMR